MHVGEVVGELDQNAERESNGQNVARVAPVRAADRPHVNHRHQGGADNLNESKEVRLDLGGDARPPCCRLLDVDEKREGARETDIEGAKQNKPTLDAPAHRKERPRVGLVVGEVKPEHEGAHGDHVERGSNPIAERHAGGQQEDQEERGDHENIVEAGQHDERQDQPEPPGDASKRGVVHRFQCEPWTMDLPRQDQERQAHESMDTPLSRQFTLDQIGQLSKPTPSVR